MVIFNSYVKLPEGNSYNGFIIMIYSLIVVGAIFSCITVNDHNCTFAIQLATFGLLGVIYFQICSHETLESECILNIFKLEIHRS